MSVKFSTILFFLIGASVLFNLANLDFGNHEEISNPTQEGIAVIELFTSQGCSSCPAADRLLSQLIEEADQQNLPVYGLSFHVDYWNRLGWKDPYSQKAFTERQYAYASQMNQRGVYTPQMVVNGQTEFVGSNKSRARIEIGKAQKIESASNIAVQKLSFTDGTLKFHYTTDDAPGETWLNVALVEQDIATQVKRGENHGRLLKHDNVVREFEQVNLKTSDNLDISLPPGLDLAKSKLILYTQNKSSLSIEQATSVTLSKYHPK